MTADSNPDRIGTTRADDFPNAAPPLGAVGLIGAGLLGAALAERLLGAGFSVWGYDVAADRLRALAEIGGKPLPSATDVLRQCDRVMLSLPDSNCVRSVIESWMAASREFKGERAATLVVDTTTGSPADSEAAADTLADCGVRYVSATVAGSSAEARRGEALVLAGGQDDALRDAAPLLNSFARQVFHVGGCGAAARMKLVFNLVLGLHRAVLAEGLEFARSQGLDRELALDILRSGAANSQVMALKGPKMVREDFSPQARLVQHLKDVRLILESGANRGAQLPLSSLHASLLAQAVAEGWGDLDNSAIINVFRARASQPPEFRSSGT